MKKSFLLLACLLSVFTSCSDDDDKVSEIVLNAQIVGKNNTYQITDAATAATFSSENASIASVSDKGVVSAIFCGETNIVITENGSIRKLKVTVKPVYDFAIIPSFKVNNCTEERMTSFLKSIGGGNLNRTTDGDMTDLTYTISSSTSKVSSYQCVIFPQNRSALFGDSYVFCIIYMNKKLVSEAELRTFVKERFEIEDVADTSFSKSASSVSMIGTSLLGDEVSVNEFVNAGVSYYAITLGLSSRKY